MTGGVQSPLDRSHRTAEPVAHFLQGLALEVKCQQGLAVQCSKLLESKADLIGPFPLKDAVNRSSTGNGGERFGGLNGFLRSANSAIDRHANGDPFQPADETFRFPQLIELPQGPHENVLGDFHCFRPISQPTQAD
jgi:hypothetical protein